MQYLTKQGDTFDLIAKKFYKNEVYIKELIAANPEYVSTIIFQNGITLNIPDISEDETTNQDNLIPWR